MTNNQKAIARKYLKQYFSLVGTQKIAANQFGLTPQAINNWLTRGMIPERFVEDICQIIHCKPNDLRPDLFD